MIVTDDDTTACDPAKTEPMSVQSRHRSAAAAIPMLRASPFRWVLMARFRTIRRSHGPSSTVVAIPPKRIHDPASGRQSLRTLSGGHHRLHRHLRLCLFLSGHPRDKPANVRKEGDSSARSPDTHAAAQQLHDEPHAQDNTGGHSCHPDTGQKHQHVGMRFVMQLLSGGMSIGGPGGGVAFFAHIGGFVAGMALIGFFKRPEVRFFSPAKTRRWDL